MSASALVLTVLLAAAVASESKTVIGPSNPALAEGSEALLMGDAEEGVRLTHLGLSTASNRRERLAGLSNLCAGYAMLAEYEKGLAFCNEALDINARHWRTLNNRALIYVKLKRYAEAEADIAIAEELAPNSRTLKVVKAMLLDKTNPVSPNIVIDDRRRPDAKP